jgi:hypothetical protein
VEPWTAIRPYLIIGAFSLTKMEVNAFLLATFISLMLALTRLCIQVLSVLIFIAHFTVSYHYHLWRNQRCPKHFRADLMICSSPAQDIHDRANWCERKTIMAIHT